MQRHVAARGRGRELLSRLGAQACATAPFPKGRGERLGKPGLLPPHLPNPDRRQQLLSVPGPTRSSRAHL